MIEQFKYINNLGRFEAFNGGQTLRFSRSPSSTLRTAAERPRFVLCCGRWRQAIPGLSMLGSECQRRKGPLPSSPSMERIFPSIARNGVAPGRKCSCSTITSRPRTSALDWRLLPAIGRSFMSLLLAKKGYVFSGAWKS